MTYTLNIIESYLLDFGMYSPGNISIFPEFSVANEELQAISTSWSMAAPILASPTMAPAQFATVQECLDYYYSTASAYILSVVNTATSNAYTLGSRQKVFDATQTLCDGKQPLNSNLTSISALTTTSYGNSLLTLANTAALKGTFSLATVATTGAYSDLTGTPTILPFSFNNTASRSIVTGTGATGFQVSSSRNSSVNYSVTISTASSITSGALGVVVLEIAPTNSATPSDWVEIGRLSQGQTLGLAIALSITQPIASQVGGMIPAGYYVKLRSINTTGTPTYTYNSGQEVLL